MTTIHSIVLIYFFRIQIGLDQVISLSLWVAYARPAFILLQLDKTPTRGFMEIRYANKLHFESHCQTIPSIGTSLIHCYNLHRDIFVCLKESNISILIPPPTWITISKVREKYCWIVSSRHILRLTD